MHLGRDLLDKQLLDREGRKAGKVDDIVLEVRRGKAPRVVALELGLSTVLDRIHDGLGQWALRLERRWRVSDATPVRIGIEHVTKAGINVETDVDANQTAVYAWERWIRGVLIGHIPGHGLGGPEEEKK